MRILIITSYYHPVQTPNVYRWSSIAEYWAREGHEVHLLCSQRKGFLKEDLIRGVKVHRAGHNTLMDLVYHFRNKNNRRSEANQQASRPSKKKRWLEKIIDWTWRALYWPDGSIVWYWPAKRKLKRLLKQYSFDAIISVGLPFTAHLIVWSAKKNTPQIKWLVDIEDPFCYSKEFFVNNFFLYESLNKRVERKLLNSAHAISLTVEAARQRYLKLFPELEDKMFVTPPVFDLNLEAKRPKIKAASKRKKIIYFGAFYDHIRTPLALLNLLQSIQIDTPQFLDDYEFHFYGRTDQEAQDYFEAFPQLKPSIHLHGLISRQEVESRMLSADFLINISNKTTYHLPSKSADYLMSGKPIINICYDEMDTFKAFFDGYPAILNLNLRLDEHNIEDILAFQSFLKNPPLKQVSPAVIQQLGAPYHLSIIANQYLQLIR